MNYLLEEIARSKLRTAHAVEDSILEHFSTLEIHNEDTKVIQIQSAFIENEISEAQTGSRRSMTIKLINSTNRSFRAEELKVHGVWSVTPIELIPPNSTVYIASQSLNGTSGHIKYFTEDEKVLELKWSNPSLGEAHVEYSYSLVFLIHGHIVQGKKSFAEIIILRNPAMVDGADHFISFLEMATYCNRFDVSSYFLVSKKELKLLHKQFLWMCEGRDYMVKEDFKRIFPAFQNDTVVSSLFSAFDEFRARDDRCCFEEWARAMSIMSRGTFEEKINLSFRICDLNRDGYVEPDEVLSLTTLISDIMVNIGFDREVFGEPREIVLNIFQSREYEHEATRGTIASEVSRTATIEATGAYPLLEGLTRSEFIEYAKEDADMAECFGLFNFLTRAVLAPIEKKLGQTGPPFFTSEALIVKGKKFHKFIIRDGMLAIFRVDITGHAISFLARGLYRPTEKERPLKVVSLGNAGVRRLPNHNLLITAAKWQERIQVQSRKDQQNWIRAIRGSAKGNYRHRSSYPIRLNINTKWFVNAEEYWSSLVPAILNANYRIYISDWYLSAELYLIRGKPLNDNYRLDKLLRTKAKQGVLIYILLWNASQIALDIHSTFTKQYLNLLHKNIYVITHPRVTPVSWSHHQKFVVIDEELAFVGGVDLCYSRYDDGRYLVSDENGETYPGRDYQNLGLHCENNGRWDKDVIDRRKTPRMPWHDIHMQIDGDAAADVAKNFIQRWNHSMDSTRPPLGKLYLLPFASQRTRTQMSQTHRGNGSQGPGKSPLYNCAVQVLRQVSEWSSGVSEAERSIYKAYLVAIANAQNYIYIENQYFISSIDKDNPQNRIAEALFKRICKAISNGERFRVIVVLPVFPAGRINDISTLYLIKLQFQTIGREGGSLLEKLKAQFPDVDINEYITFHALRNWGTIGTKFVTEQIYVHSKLMIVDDKTVIIGSANINDRSMRGLHDSEIAVMVNQLGSNQIESILDGVPTTVSAFAFQLRMRLWRDWLGLASDDMSIADPVSDEVYQFWKSTSHHNAEIYRRVFPGIPENATTLAEFLQNQNLDPIETYRLQQLRGYLIDFPMDMMKNETGMQPTVRNKEFLLPKKLYF